ncbi:MAG TPA: type IV toxin-antitoxin system AbiEi family antitoxin domain-containing protein [Acidimicrobiales bacterium]|nr:type IV toxin-antitoxin system AbiEi family antitoxin domain-containing protein [Acidimicrobiales bacterium]
MHLISSFGQALEVAADQHHLLATSDLTRHGLDRNQVSDLCRDGALERIVRGLYRIPGTRSPMQDIAAAVSRHRDGHASHVSGLFVHGAEVTPPRRPQLTLPVGATGHTTLGDVHRSPLDRADVTRRLGIRVTSLARSLVDASAHLSTERLHEVVAAELTARRTTLALVQQAALRVESGPGRLGHGRLRQVLATWADPITPGSVAEATVFRRIGAFGLPRPSTQVEIRTTDGDFVARVDLAWEDHRVAREYDSDGYHPPPKVEADERRRQAIEAAGWKVDVVHRGHLLPSREDWLLALARDIGRPSTLAG